jgi:hypothetical protein
LRNLSQYKGDVYFIHTSSSILTDKEKLDIKTALSTYLSPLVFTLIFFHYTFEQSRGDQEIVKSHLSGVESYNINYHKAFNWEDFNSYFCPPCSQIMESFGIPKKAPVFVESIDS